MGLDQMLIKITDRDKFVKLNKEIDALDDVIENGFNVLSKNLKNWLTEEKINEFKRRLESISNIDKFLEDFNFLKEKEFYDKLTVFLIRLKAKNIESLESQKIYENDEDIFITLKFILFNFFPLINDWGCELEDDKKDKLKNEITKEFIKFTLNDLKDFYNKNKELIKNINHNRKIQDKLLTELDGLQESLIYWRKANMIHKWMLDNIPESDWYNYDCETMPFDKTVIDKLKGTCKEVVEYLSPFISEEKKEMSDLPKEVKEKASELLPTMEGFFFGPTDIDYIYYQKVKYTLENLEKIEDENSFFIYTASY